MKTSSIYRAELTWGIYSRVALRLGIGRAHVCRVAKGERKSPRVESAIRTELRKIDRLVEKYERQAGQQVAA